MSLQQSISIQNLYPYDNLGLDVQPFVHHFKNGKIQINGSKGWALKTLRIINSQGNASYEDWIASRLSDVINGNYKDSDRKNLLESALQLEKTREKFKHQGNHRSKEFNEASKAVSESKLDNLLVDQLKAAFLNRCTKLDYKQLHFIFNSLGEGFTINLYSLINWKSTSKNKHKIIDACKDLEGAVWIQLSGKDKQREVTGTIAKKSLTRQLNAFNSSLFKHIGERKMYNSSIDWVQDNGDIFPVLNLVVFGVEEEKLRDWLSREKRRGLRGFKFAKGNEQVIRLALEATQLYTRQYARGNHSDDRLWRLALNWATHTQFRIVIPESLRSTTKEERPLNTETQTFDPDAIKESWIEKKDGLYRCDYCPFTSTNKSDFVKHLKQTERMRVER